MDLLSKNMLKGTLHLIPNLLAENTIHTIPSYILPVIQKVRIFYVEEIKSARRFLKKMDREINIDELEFHILNEHHQESLSLAKNFFLSGKEIAYISEAGCPAVADPGAELVKMAHDTGAKVMPYIGANSIIMALMASGFNGQKFFFHGYLPNKQPMLSQKIKEIELHSKTQHCTQIFIETPYRNNQLLEEIIKTCHADTRLCIASDITGEKELIISLPLSAWKKQTYNFHKIPAVFVLYARE